MAKTPPTPSAYQMVEGVSACFAAWNECLLMARKTR
jgi:hypothetical protein